MPNPNAIVATTVRLDPPLHRAPDERLLAEGGIADLLDGERRARLDPADARSVGFARVLDGLARQRLPVYLEIDPASEAITRLLIPHIVRVVGIGSAGGALAIGAVPRRRSSRGRRSVPAIAPRLSQFRPA